MSDAGFVLPAEPMQASESEVLTVLRIKPTQAQTIKLELRTMGIHSATVYGDLTSVCREIESDLTVP
jgi:hypothetical protein